ITRTYNLLKYYIYFYILELYSPIQYSYSTNRGFQDGVHGAAGQPGATPPSGPRWRVCSGSTQVKVPSTFENVEYQALDRDAVEEDGPIWSWMRPLLAVKIQDSWQSCVNPERSSDESCGRAKMKGQWIWHLGTTSQNIFRPEQSPSQETTDARDARARTPRFPDWQNVSTPSATGLEAPPIRNNEWAIVPYTPIPTGANVPIIAITAPEGATEFLDTRDRRDDGWDQGRWQSEGDVEELRKRMLEREALDAKDSDKTSDMEELWEERLYWPEDGMPPVFYDYEEEEEAGIEHWEGVGPSGEPVNGPFAPRPPPSRRWSL
ncbi:hypothetical protein QBC39DRAFT_400221, partial [Podospora conica]